MSRLMPSATRGEMSRGIVQAMQIGDSGTQAKAEEARRLNLRVVGGFIPFLQRDRTRLIAPVAQSIQTCTRSGRSAGSLGRWITASWSRRAPSSGVGSADLPRVKA